ncbi:hypothetical protein GCM10011329_01050 [Stakelama pacifica]|nr:hypothetical protein GCM10011329_01050 [Stakelama pacifica]
MERIDLNHLSEAILTAPGWARVGLTVADEHMRKEAALELAQSVAKSLTEEPRFQDRNQLNLPI